MNPSPVTFISAYEAALASQQWEQVAPLMHPDVCVTFSDGSVYKGVAEVEQAYRRNFALIREEKFTITGIHWVRLQPALAVYVFVFNWIGLINDKPASGSGHGTATLIWEGGKWLLLAEQLGK